MQPSELPAAMATYTLQQLRQQEPLVHCLTNEVVQAITANTLLALGAAPAMVVESEEAAQFSAIADALLINIGTLYQQRATAMLKAVVAAKAAETPWVLDPVGVGELHYRSDFARLLLTMRPAAVRGNASEILALAGIASTSRGIDSRDDSLQALSAAKELAEQCDAVVVVTGAVDVITNGRRTWQIKDGHPLMTRVTGIGCALSAVTAACCALPGEKLDHIAGACRLIARAGRLTASWAAGPGSFSTGLLDKLYQLGEEDLQ